jgi:ligand-binding sensor domain-containing protein/signal transduction histidine kinase/DNA-binding response OmpR family regulator
MVNYLFKICNYRFGLFSSFLRVFFVVAIAFASVCAAKSQSRNLYFENYTTDNGLSNNMVHCFFQDSRGWMWFGTSQGLNRFDGYKFTAFKNDPDDKQSLTNDLVRVIFEDSKENLWIGTENGGLYKYNRDKENFLQFAKSQAVSSLSNNSVNAVVEDNGGNLWVGTEDGLNKMNPTTGSFYAYYHKNDDTNSLSNNAIRALLIDHIGELWIGTSNGLELFDPVNNRFKHFRLPQKDVADNEICKIFEDIDGKLWIGTYTGGVVIFDPSRKAFSSLNLDVQNKRSNTVRSIIRDKDGLYWIGTRGGVYIYSKEKGVVSHFERDERESTGLCHNSILDIFQDAKGDIWIGTRGGVSYLVREKQIFSHYKALPNDIRYLNNREVYAFWIDPKKNIWVGTENGGINILDRKKDVFQYLTRNKSFPNSLSNNCIKAFMDDRKGNLWIGTYMGGINVYNLKTKAFSRLEHSDNDPNSLVDNKVWALYYDSNGKIWVGTEHGVDQYNSQNNNFLHFQKSITDKPVNWISEDDKQNLWVGTRDEVVIYEKPTGKVIKYKERTRAFCLDSHNRIWLATQGKGIALYSKNNGPLKYYSEKNGLSNNLTFSVLEDSHGDLWISTGKGLSRFSPGSEKFKNFDKDDGLPSNHFNYGAFYKSASGELLFGGINGFTIINPNDVVENSFVPPIVFTDFKIFNQSVSIGNSKYDILQNSITESRQITLPYNQNVLTFEFAALNYARSNKNKYTFILEGFEKKWNNAGNMHSATYTNLNPGNYVLRVKASNSDNKWNEKGIALNVKILPPWWKTWWFKIFTVLTLLSIIYALIAFFAARVKLKHELIFERDRAQKMHELDMMKLKFFTNVSHEIRTPLTLIIGPLEKMLSGNIPSEMAKSYVSIMHRNATQLNRLISQLLDFRKLESGNLKLELSKGDLVSFISGIVQSFAALAGEKGIKLKFNTIKNEVFTWFDPDKVEKIINNLLTNAIKFTKKDGQISVNLSLVLDSYESLVTSEGKFVEIVVKDNGIGIQESNLEKIFQRFFQVPNSMNQTGTGIGLALTKELVKLHKGRIFVESKPGKGTKFTVRLPYDNEIVQAKPQFDVSEIKSLENTNLSAIEERPVNVAPSKIMVIVEDNQDVRFFIRTHFEADFQVIEAKDGKEGWQVILNVIPDIIVSDIMMSGLDGTELCRKIKKDERTSHIPVIIITALSSREHRLSGLDAGADDYITKPFDVAILMAKVENLLVLRKSLKEKYTGELILKPKNITITLPDERFLQKSIEIVEKHISNPEFSIDQFATDLGVSRMQLYRKMEALTDMTVKEFIRDIRLKRAAQMLVQNKMNVSEIAYHVGFNDLSHFRKCFRQEFGMSATEYVEKHT